MKLLITFFAVLIAFLAWPYQAAAQRNCYPPRPRCCNYQRPGCFTTQEYDPVCGRNNCNYGNEGMAICGGTSAAYKGRCL